ncbi:MAG: outer membrane protein assembly factor BamD [Paracoccaceae bacterium]
MSGALQSIRSLAFISVLLVAACSSKNPDQVSEGMPVNQIMALAAAEVARGDYEDAADYFNEVERLYPYSGEAKLAIIGLAKAYHEEQMYPESRAAAARYLDFYPTTADAPLAMYLIALSYYDQIVDVKRDQRNTFRSLQIFSELIETYPGTEYARLSEEKFDVALNQLAGKEMDIGRYYLKRGHYVAAIERFRVVIADYGNTAQTPEAMFRLIEAFLLLGLTGEAAKAAEMLAEQYSGNVWQIDAAALMSGG